MLTSKFMKNQSIPKAENSDDGTQGQPQKQSFENLGLLNFDGKIERSPKSQRQIRGIYSSPASNTGHNYSE